MIFEKVISMLGNNKKIIKYVSVILAVSIIMIVITNCLPSAYETKLLRDKESEYLQDKSFTKWLQVCEPLLDSNEYDMILSYFPEYIESDQLYSTYYNALEHNEVATAKFVNGYRFTYAQALLGVGELQDFKSYILELAKLYDKSSIMSNLYINISGSLTTNTYDIRQLNAVLETLKEMYKNFSKNDSLKLQNLCLQAYIYDSLNDNEAYEKIQKDISNRTNQGRTNQGTVL